MSWISQTISQLSKQEKCALGSGADTWKSKAIPRLQIPSILFHDGPHGLRKQSDSTDALGLNESVPASCFPAAVTSACSFDRNLLFEIGAALAKEAIQQGIDVVLGPGINIKRSPLCGRNFEYFSEDPFLTGELAAAYILGMQSQGVGASLKHLAANNQEYCRLINNSQVDERALREIYLKAFEIAVKKAQPWTIMGSYNRLNGTYSCQNKWLLTQVVREEWGFEGLFISDWGAVEDRVNAVKAGLDLEMPSSGNYRDQQLYQALKTGKIDQASCDRAVTKLLQLVEKCKTEKPALGAEVYQENHELAKRVLTESAVLLKNEGDLLPLKPSDELLVVGELAENPHYQGSGSSRVNPTQVISLTQALEKTGLTWQYCRGYQIDGEADDKELLETVCQAAEGKQAVIVVAGLTEEDEAESYDRQHLRLQSRQNALIEKLAEVNPNLIVILQGGGVMELPWLEKVRSLLFVGLAGQAIGQGCLDLVLGKANPSGKLAESWPMVLEDVPSGTGFGQRFNTPYLESIFVGYRYYSSAKKDVRFPFGHGLSYTNFEFSDLQLSQSDLKPGETLEVRVNIKNRGGRAGKEVAQLYVSAPKSVLYKAERELKNFDKVALEPGETREVSLSVSHEDLAVWNSLSHQWQVEGGKYQILLGSSSSYLPLQAEIQVSPSADSTDVPDFREQTSQYYALPQQPFEFSLEQFEKLPDSVRVAEPDRTKDKFDLNSTLWDAQHSWHGRLIAKFALKASANLVEQANDQSGNTERIVQASTIDAPLRSYIMGGVPMSVIKGMSHLLNKEVLRGIWFLLKGMITKQ
jgi:beta-glucosidase